MVVSGGEVRNRAYSITKVLYEAKRRRRNSGAWGVARNTLIRFRLPYARTAAGLSPFDPAPLIAWAYPGFAFSPGGPGLRNPEGVGLKTGKTLASNRFLKGLNR